MPANVDWTLLKWTGWLFFRRLLWASVRALIGPDVPFKHRSLMQQNQFATTGHARASGKDSEPQGTTKLCSRHLSAQGTECSLPFDV